MMRSIRERSSSSRLAGHRHCAFPRSPSSRRSRTRRRATPSKVSKGDVDRAHTVFLSGKQYLDESNYDKAISYFNDAYSIDCSVHAILPIIATAYERKGDKGEAIRALEEYLRRAPTAPDREVIERRIKNLKDQLAREPPPAPPPSATPVATPPASAEPASSAGPGRERRPPQPPPPPSPAPAEAHHGAGPGSGGRRRRGHARGRRPAWIGGAAQVSSASVACPGRAEAAQPDVVSRGNDGRKLTTVGPAVGGRRPCVLGAGLIWHFLEPVGQDTTNTAVVSHDTAPWTGIRGSRPLGLSLIALATAPRCRGPTWAPRPVDRPLV